MSPMIFAIKSGVPARTSCRWNVGGPSRMPLSPGKRGASSLARTTLAVSILSFRPVMNTVLVGSSEVTLCGRTLRDVAELRKHALGFHREFFRVQAALQRLRDDFDDFGSARLLQVGAADAANQGLGDFLVRGNEHQRRLETQ